MLMTKLMSPETGQPSLSSLRAIWRDHEEFLQSGACAADLRLGITASFTANNLVPFIGAHLLEAGLLPSIKLAPYDQIFRTCFDPAQNLGADCNCAIVLWRIEDLMFDELASFADGKDTAIFDARKKLDHLVNAVLDLRRKISGMLILSIPPFPSHGTRDVLAVDSKTSPFAFHAAIANHARDRLRSVESIYGLEWDAIQASFGISASLDWRQWYLYHQPFTEKFLQHTAQIVGRLILAARRPPKKCILLDADNTLWGGVIGEEGLEGIAIGTEFPGSAYRDFQRQLLHLRSRGVMLAIVSKNNEEDVWTVFDRHGGMLLKREHISAWAISWKPKVEAIPLIAQKLNIGSDSFVFIDDNPLEIACMRQRFPEVDCVLLPDEPAAIVPTIQELRYFDTLQVTQEDRQRATMMQAEAARNALGATILTHEEFQRALELKVSLSPSSPDELGRVTQLINKTNQFNLTTIRRSLDEVRTLAESARYTLYSVRVSDKFGDYGLTGVLIIDTQDPKNWKIDTLLLSCRVLGRGVENEVFSALAEYARNAGATAISARYLPTSKNEPAKSYLADLGFLPREDNWWQIELSKLLQPDS